MRDGPARPALALAALLLPAAVLLLASPPLGWRLLAYLAAVLPLVLSMRRALSEGAAVLWQPGASFLLPMLATAPGRMAAVLAIGGLALAVVGDAGRRRLGRPLPGGAAIALSLLFPALLPPLPPAAGEVGTEGLLSWLAPGLLVGFALLLLGHVGDCGEPSRRRAGPAGGAVLALLACLASGLALIRLGGLGGVLPQPLSTAFSLLVAVSLARCTEELLWATFGLLLLPYLLRTLLPGAPDIAPYLGVLALLAAFLWPRRGGPNGKRPHHR